jgi:A/G-specific adenine glycosylase
VKPAGGRAGAAAGPRQAGFSRLLVEWYGRGHRDLPWRRTTDPYRIWVSEIMLQQTRAAAVVPYYQRFLERFPTVETLAAAPEDQVLALWSGLGYYSRARNLRRAAREIAGAGGFPRDYESWRRLPGVGDYTAAAIASIAFGQARAVLDGNVLRVVARVANDASDIAAPATRERFRGLAQAWLGPHDPAVFNQALMELGATVCLPRNPQCALCPVAAHCQASRRGTVAQLPVKLGRKEPVRLAESLLVVRSRGRVLLRQRGTDARRMAGFWDLPASDDLPQARTGNPIGEFRHTITHHRYIFTVLGASMVRLAPGRTIFRWFSPSQFTEIPLSTTARKGLRLAGVL